MNLLVAGTSTPPFKQVSSCLVSSVSGGLAVAINLMIFFVDPSVIDIIDWFSSIKLYCGATTYNI